jgi:hypothetical protein
MSALPRQAGFGGIKYAGSGTGGQPFDPSQPTYLAGLAVIDGGGNVRWKIEVGRDEKLSIMFSNDAGATYTLKMRISPD